MYVYIYTSVCVCVNWVGGWDAYPPGGSRGIRHTAVPAGAPLRSLPGPGRQRPCARDARCRCFRARPLPRFFLRQWCCSDPLKNNETYPATKPCF